MNPQDQQNQQPYQPPQPQPQLPPQPVQEQHYEHREDIMPSGFKNPLSVMQKNEVVVCEIKRHPIGLLGLYVASGLAIVIMGALIFVGIPFLNLSNQATIIKDASLIAACFVALILIYLYIAHYVYVNNRWIITSDSITQVSQVSLFSRQSSQLSMGNLEDVTAEQNGIIANMFGYGLLKAETAGEHSKFQFPYCPNPNYYAQQILNAREIFESGRSEGQAPQPPTVNTNVNL